jgi:hypothetical protein
VRTGGFAPRRRTPCARPFAGADRTAIVSRVSTLESQLDELLAPRRFQTWFDERVLPAGADARGGGVYGVMHYVVAERRREIAIRVALGARPADVALMVMRESMGVATLGLALGLGGAFAIAG